jgi:hypothetical protein
MNDDKPQERLTATDEPGAEATERAGVQEPNRPAATAPAAPVDDAETDAEDEDERQQTADEAIEPNFTTPVERVKGVEEERELSGTGTEIPPGEGEVADTTSGGGTQGGGTGAFGTTGGATAGT